MMTGAMSTVVTIALEAHLFILVGLGMAWSRQFAKRVPGFYSSRWIGRYPRYVGGAAFFVYVPWLAFGVQWPAVQAGNVVALTLWLTEGVALTVLLARAVRRLRAPAHWTRADYDRFVAADAPRWWRRQQEEIARARPPAEDYERMSQLEDSILGPPPPPRVKRRRRPSGRPRR
jgi:hypothetical protein